MNSYHKKYSRKRNRQSFDAIWIGQTDYDGFMTHNKVYKIKEITKTGHYRFYNDSNKLDMAHPKRFKIEQVFDAV